MSEMEIYENDWTVSYFSNTTVSCLQGFTLEKMDPLSPFSYGLLAPISTILSFFLVFGYLKYKKLKERPGDIIASLAATNLILSVHWMIMYWYPNLYSDNEGCFINGIIALFVGFANYLYNVAFVLYLQQRVRNALKKSRIVKSYVVHLCCLGIALLGTFYMIAS